MTDRLEHHLTSQADAGRFFWHRVRWQKVRRHLPRRETLTVLDVGAGAGHLGRALLRDIPRARYAFCEPIRGLRESLLAEFGAESDWTDRVDYSAADVVTLLDVLEHQEDGARFLEQLARRVRPGSPLLLTVPALPALWSDWDAHLGHHLRYTRRTLREALIRGGWAADEVTYLFPELLPAALLRRFRRRTDQVEFPALPALVNEALFWLGTATAAAAPFNILGTSLFAAARAATEP